MADRKNTTPMEIPLTKGAVALVDPEDYEDVSRFKWTLDDGPLKYANRTIRKDNGVYTSLRMHVYLMKPPPSVRVDHRDGNGLNNQRYNLRFATQMQNAWNSTGRGSNTGYKGVTLVSRLKFRPYLSRIHHNGKTICLGYFPTAEEAAARYDEAVVELCSEFAQPNGVLDYVPSDSGWRRIVSVEKTAAPGGRGHRMILTLECGHQKELWSYRWRSCEHSRCSQCFSHPVTRNVL